jgi:hypothetical protein
MKKRRTEDNIFILHTLFQKYVKRNRQRLYVAFIDFTKFFDTINRDMLMYKLIKYNITGNIYKVIKAAYEDSQYSVKTRQGNTPYFKSNSGVKQGCNLSTLSNIYQNDLHEIFDGDSDPVNMDDYSFNSVSWADDLVLVSRSFDGLQNCMNKLYSYCNKWGIVLNVDKSKYMVMSSGTVKKYYNLMYNGNCIEPVVSFKYLGMILCSNGKFKNAILDRHNKAQKAYYQIKGALSTSSNVSRRLAMSIFDKQITPILLYGSCIWGQNEKFGMIKLKFNSPDMLNKASIADMCKTILKRDLNFDIVRYDKIKCEAIIKVHNLVDKLDLVREGHFEENVCIENSITQQKHLCEKLHTDFCKFVLGMSKYSSDYAVLGELGRVPMGHKMLLSHIMYWLQLEQGTSNELLNHAYRECTAGAHDFIESVKQILLSNGMGYILQNDNKITISKNMLKILINQRLRDQYIQEYESKICDSFVELSLCKRGYEYTCSDYLDIVKSPSIRTVFSRLRIKQSKLKGHQFNIDDMNCIKCNMTEDTKHLLFECQEQKLVEVRYRYLNSIHKLLENFEYLSTEEQVRQVLNLNFHCKPECNSEIQRLTCKFVNDMYHIRFPGH